jgi:hypothetical protein
MIGTMSNLATVQNIYAAFGRGDVPAILDALAEDVAWESWHDHSAQKAGVPWLRAINGRDGVASFFQIASQFQFHDFQVLSLMEGPNQVAAEVVLDATVTSGARIADEEMHLWTFNAAGKVSRFRHYVDTAKHTAAAGL